MNKSLESLIMKWEYTTKRISSDDIERRVKSGMLFEKAVRMAEVDATFVDASLEGWGGVVVEQSGALTVVGDIWRQEKGLHINILEAKALLNTLLALDLWDLKGFRLDIRVDNTSVMGAVRKRCQKNKILNDVVLAVWLIFKKVVFSVKYIKSALNPADGPSRTSMGLLSSEKLRSQVIQAVGLFFRT